MGIDLLFDKGTKYHRKIRGILFKPFIKLMDKAGITPNGITNFRFLLAGLFVVLFNTYRTASIILITISIFLDSLDGPLARYLKIDSDKGKFLDFLVDVFTYSLIVLTFLFVGVDALYVVLNILLVNYAHLVAVVKKKEFVKSDWIIQPSANSAYLTLPAVLAFYLFHLFSIDYLLWSLYLSTALSFVCFIYYYSTIQLRWKRKA